MPINTQWKKHTRRKSPQDKEKDPTTQFREYMLNRNRRIKLRERILMWTLIVIALALFLFIVLACIVEA